MNDTDAKRETDSTLSYKISMLHEDVGGMKTALKELAVAITRFAIVEERQAQTAIALERAFKTLEKVEGRVTAQEGVSVSINNALQVHLMSIKDIQIKFDRHVEGFEKFEEQQQGLVNRGLGAWKILAWVLAGAQAVVMAGALFLRNDLADLHTSVENLRQTDVRIIERMNSESGKK